jgi:hypothetical protein
MISWGHFGVTLDNTAISAQAGLGPCPNHFEAYLVKVRLNFSCREVHFHRSRIK